MPTKAQLTEQLKAARATIVALRSELAQPEDPNDNPDWADLRGALEGHVPSDANHGGLVSEAADIIRKWDKLEDVATSVDFEDWSEDDLLTAMETHRTFEAVGMTLDSIGLQLWRSGKAPLNATDETILTSLEATL